MPTVYITQESGGRSFLPARKFGKLVALLPNEAQVVLSAAPTIRKLRRGLKDFTQEDFLLLSGDPLIMGLAIWIALDNSQGKCSFLKWDKIERDYYDVDVDIHDKGEY